MDLNRKDDWHVHLTLASREDQCDLTWEEGRMASDLRTMARAVLEMLS